MFRLLFAACWHSLLRNRRMREHRWQKWRELMRLANELTHFHAHHPRIHSKRWRETINIELMIHSNIQNAMLLTRLLWNHKLGRREGGKRTRRCHNSGTESQGRREGGKTSRRCTNSGTESDSHKQYSLQMTSCCDTVQVFFLGGSFLLRQLMQPWSQFSGHKGPTNCREESQGCVSSDDLLGYLRVYGCPHNAQHWKIHIL